MKPGDVVTLRSGSPPMTVARMQDVPSVPPYRLVECQWFTDGEMFAGRFPSDTLIAAVEAKGAGLGAFVRVRREARGLTREALEHLAGLGRGTVSRVELGTTRMPTAKTIARLARHLGCKSIDLRSAWAGAAS